MWHSIDFRGGCISVIFSALTISLLTVVLLAACGSTELASDSAEETAASAFQRYKLHGKVVQLDADNKAATIEHEEIAGWMDAMTMRFPVKEDAEWAKLQEGAVIDATVFVNDDGFHIGEIEPAGEMAEPTEQP